MIIPVPDFLDDPLWLFSHQSPVPVSTADSLAGRDVLTFSATTFWDLDIVLEDQDAVVILNAYAGSSRRWTKGGCDVWGGHQTFELVVMSGSRPKDTWFKRRNGTSALPPAPRQLRSRDFLRPLAEMKAELWRSHYQRGNFQESWMPAGGGVQVRESGDDEPDEDDDDPVLSVNLMLIATGPRLGRQPGREFSERLWVYSTTRLKPRRLRQMKRRVIELI
jgi:hypothetical protein